MGNCFCLTTSEQKLFAAIGHGDKFELLKISHGNTIDLSKTVTDGNGDTFLHSAFKYGPFYLGEVLEIFVDHGVDINAKDKSGKTLFHLACENKRKSVIDLCIRRNANVKVRDKRGDTGAHLAIEDELVNIKKVRPVMRINRIKDQIWYNENSSIVDWMVSRGVDFFYAKNQSGLSALYLANEYGLYHILLTLLERVTDLPSVEKDQTPLLSSFFAVFNTQSPAGKCDEYYYDRYVPRIVEIIIEKSNFISDTTLSTCLRMAIAHAEHEMSVIELLLQRSRTNINLHNDADGSKSLLETLFNERLKGHNGRTIAQTLYWRCPSIEMLQLLKDFKVDFNVVDDQARSFLHLSSECHRNFRTKAEVIDFLMNESCDMNVTDSRGKTPLHVAAGSYCDEHFIKTLIEHGAKVNVKDDQEQTPLHLAINDPKVAQLLLEAGADVNAKDNVGKTPLYYVRRAAIMKVFFSFGAHVNILDANGHSPFYNLCLFYIYQWPVIEVAILSEMLKYGADIQDSEIFKLLHVNYMSFDRYATNKWLCLEQHFIKLIAIDVHCKLPFATDKIMDPNNPLLKKCRREVELLKNYFIDDRTSLYCLLRKNRNRRCAYLDNEKLKNLVDDAAIKRKFPNYSVLILGCYNGAARRNPLLESSTHILNELSESCLPDLCIDEILTFLSNIDLLRFIEAFENVNLDGLCESIGKINV